MSGILLGASTRIQAAAGGGSNVAYDTSAESTAGLNTNTRSISITVAANSNKLLLVGAGAGSTNVGDRTVTGVSSSVNGAFTSVQNLNDASTQWVTASVWKLVNPTAGAHTITVTYHATNNAEQCYAAAISLYNVDQTTPTGTVGTSNTDAATVSASVTLGTDDMGVSFIVTDSEASLSATTGTERQKELNVGTDTAYGLSTITGSGSTAMSWSHSTPNYVALIAVPVNGAP